jgi:hypothetical protein
VIPDSIEVDIESSNQSDSYGYLRYRTQRTQSQCETEVASAIKVRGISSGTYTLTRTNQTADRAVFEYSSNALSGVITVQTTPSLKWAGNFPNKFGPGIYVSINPVKTVGWSRRWPTYSSLSSTVPTEADLDSVSASQTFNESGIVNTTILAISNGQLTNYYSEAISACVGGNATFTPGTFTIVSRSTLLPWDVNASYIEPGLGFVDDYNAVKRWTRPYGDDTCGRGFPSARGLFIDAGGDYQKTEDRVDNSFTNSFNGFPEVIPFRFLTYQLKLIRTLTITAIRGLLNDGTLIELINDPR